MQIPITIIVLSGILFAILLFVNLKYKLKNKTMNIELQKAREQFHSVIGSAKDAIILSDSKSRIISWNRGAELIFGYREEEVLAKNLQIILPERYRGPHHEGMKRFLSTNIPKVIGHTVELTGLNKNGKEMPIELSLSAWEIDNETFFSGIIRDITERKKAEERIKFIAFHDDLTQLPNRRFFNQILEKELIQAKLTDESVIVMILDLDGFKIVNDTFGHAVGDLLLREIANRLNQVIEKRGFVARIGGDEFTLLMTNVKHISEATAMANKIIELIEKPVIIYQKEIFVSVSIGIVHYPDNGQAVETLMKRADKAMYLAKAEHKSNYKFYNSSFGD
ncbi:diguanylate cyclase domain-containing protein [Bacillus sp. 1NLA3E]|uniref:diguanylate cyclase domain-containing protein n=1 Tax=Bacillus sp. 1NLA3E TaxID=666686 RepID=UPI000247F124|nr:diguanylate cyclase [Bacillus sp. 1NLA3E]AGK55564.1 diguanylate cyclase/phosphodiesterase with PAS/PAC and MHYT sensor(s) [Bacillus sp. 1NLA3E]